MEIEAAGRTWTVETERHEPIGEGAEPSWCVSFVDGRGERLAIGWVPGTEELSPVLARRLFELAGERIWKDASDGSPRRVTLGIDDVEGDESDRLTVTFHEGDAARTTVYDLDRPLGQATDGELQELMARARSDLRTVHAAD